MFPRQIAENMQSGGSVGRALALLSFGNRG